MSDTENSHLAVGERADMREIINWQQERYQHIQLLAQGFLASSLTILAVVATVFTAFGNPIPSIPMPESPQGPAYVGRHASLIIVGFANFMWMILAFESIMMFITSVWKFIGLVLERPLLSDKKMTDMVLLSDKYKGGMGVDDIYSQYPTLIQQNNEDLDLMRERFRFAGFRFPGSLLIGFGAIELYLFSARFDLVSIVLMSLLFLVLSFTDKIFDKVSNSSEISDETTPREVTLFQEFKLGEEHELSRWHDIDQFWWEKGLFVLLKAFSSIIIFAFILSYFV